MRAALFVALAIVALAAFATEAKRHGKVQGLSSTHLLHRVKENAKGKWHVYSAAATQQAHEAIVQAAHDGLTTVQKALFDVPKMKQGVVWNDMPEGNYAHEDAMINDGHMDGDTFLRMFQFHQEDELVHASHYGCLQYWHSMAPLQRLQSALPANDANRWIFTNAEVKEFILQQAEDWWNLAKGHLAAKVKYSWYLGHILHMIQDSFPKGHVVRDATAAVCGDILLFQGYDAQHGNEAHKLADFIPPSKGIDATDVSLSKRVGCATDASKFVLDAFAACATAGSAAHASCGFATVRAHLDTVVYKLAATAGARKAGGASEPYISPTAKANFDVEVVATAAGNLNLYNPKSGRMWSTSHGVHLCAGTKEIQSKCATGVGVYLNHDFVAPLYHDWHKA